MDIAEILQPGKGKLKVNDRRLIFTADQTMTEAVFDQQIRTIYNSQLSAMLSENFNLTN